MTTVVTILAVMFLLCVANYNFQLGDELSNVFGLITWIIILIIVFGWIMGLLGGVL